MLASGSPRRRALLEEAGIAFTVATGDVAEWAPERGDPHEVAVENARRKAAAAPAMDRVANDSAAGDRIVLAADTVVALGDLLLGKPRDAGHARSILCSLSGTTHSVVTGVALRSARGIQTKSVETRVTMRTWTAAELDAYVASGEPMGKAGAYAIQETADRFVTDLDGPYDNVVGLPIVAVRELLAEVDA